MGKVRFSKDLNEDSIEAILQEHFNDSELKVISVTGDEDFLAQNENFNSQIKKWTVIVEKNGNLEGSYLNTANWSKCLLNAFKIELNKYLCMLWNITPLTHFKGMI